VDRTVVELFADGRACITARIYEPAPDASPLAAFARGAPSRARVDVWEMKSIW